MRRFSSLVRWREMAEGLADVVEVEMREEFSSSGSSKSLSSRSERWVSSPSFSVTVSRLNLDWSETVLLLGAIIERRPERERRRYRRSSVDCLRSSRSRVLFMARRDELEISRSSTFRSRRALLAWSNRGRTGDCGWSNTWNELVRAVVSAAISERSVSLIMEAGIVFVEVRLSDLGLNVSGDSSVPPTMRGDSVVAIRRSSGNGACARGPPNFPAD